MSKTLRADITGLRAIAVIAVALFHVSHVFNPDNSYFTGGFLGVDIFFVISGYLMTMIIVSSIEKDSFSLWDFYKRRAKRICPALLVVVFITSLIGLVVLQNAPYRTALREGLVSLGFVSNFRFARDVGYFDGGDYSHFFLHTWSLSVEWQFYIFYPIMLVLLKKCCDLKYIGRILLCLTILGVFAAAIWTEINPRQSYYLLPARACELLFGSLAFFYPIEKLLKSVVKKNDGSIDKLAAVVSLYAEVFGLILIVLSFLLIDDRSGWPTVWLLLPMAATWLCVAANNKKSVLRGFVFQKIGLWSYSIYIVHWPIVSFAAALGLGKYGALWLVPIFILGFILHILVENRRDYGVKFAITYIIGAIAVFNLDNYRLLEFFDFDDFAVYEKVGNTDFLSGSTGVLGENMPEFIIQGDSHALDLFMPLVERKVPFIYSIATNCYSLGTHAKQNEKTDINSDKQKRCSLLYQQTKAISKFYSEIPVVFVQRWSNYGFREDFDKQIPFRIYNDYYKTTDASEYFDIIKDDFVTISNDFAGRKIYIVGNKQERPSEVYGTVADPTILKHWLSDFLLKDIKNASAKYVHFEINDVLQQIIDEVNALSKVNGNSTEFIYIDPAVHCQSGYCNLFVNNDIQVYADDNHYSRAGAEKAVEHLLNILNLSYGQERTSFSELPRPLGILNQKVLKYSSEETSFYLEDCQ